MRYPYQTPAPSTTSTARAASARKMYLRIRRSRRPPVAPPLVLEDDERLFRLDSGIWKEITERVWARWFPGHQETRRPQLRGSDIVVGATRRCRRLDDAQSSCKRQSHASSGKLPTSFRPLRNVRVRRRKFPCIFCVVSFRVLPVGHHPCPKPNQPLLANLTQHS